LQATVPVAPSTCTDCSGGAAATPRKRGA
jgi:hypothetical protein